MLECFYYKGNTKINDIQSIIHEFFKDNYQLKNAAIFSAEEIQQSTIKAIKRIEGALTYNKSHKKEVTSFIVEPNDVLFSKVGIKTKTGRLAPEYIEENRIHQYIIDNLPKVDSISELTDITKYKFSQEKFDKLREAEDLKNIITPKLVVLLSEIESIIEFENKTKDFGILLHKVIALKVEEKNYIGKLREFLTDPKNAEIVGNYSVDDWVNKIETITDHIITMVKKTGVPITEIFVMSNGKSPVDKFGLSDGLKPSNEIITPEDVGLKGKIDLIAIDKSGDAHIYEIKISKTEYRNWDPAKLLTLDWQLALYRQLLGQHININKTMLYTIPIWISNLGDPNAVFEQDFVNRKTESKTGLNEGGKLTDYANRLIPRQIIADYDPDRIDKMKETLTTLIGPEYEIKTGIEDYDVDKIMANAKKRFERENVWKKWNNFEGIAGLPDKAYIEADTEEEFREKIEKYVAHVRTQVNRNVSILKDAIISAIKTSTPIKTNSYDPKKDVTVNHLLKEYLNDEWDVVDNIPETLAMGLIVLKNTITGNVNIISLSANQFYSDSKIPGMNYGDLEFLKSFLFVNTFKDELFPQKNGQLAQIIVYNPVSSQVYSRNVVTQFTHFEERMSRAGLSNQLRLNSNDHISGIEDVALYNLDVNLRRFSGSEQEQKDITEIFSLFRSTNLNEIDLKQLLDVQKTLFEKYPDYKLKTIKAELNFDDQKEVLLALLQVAIVSKSNMDLTGDFQGLSKYSLGFSDFKSLIAALYTDNLAKYNKEGKRIQGIVQGLVWTTPDWVASKDLRNINKIVSTANVHIRESMVSISEIIYGHTRKYYNEINFNESSRRTFGETQSKHKNLWAHKQNSEELSDEFRTKNPYSDSEENALTDPEREYLKSMLLMINRWKYEISDKEFKSINPMDLKSVMSNPKLAKAIEDGTYFEMPLIRKEELSRYKDLFSSPGKLWKDKVKPYLEEVQDLIDARELLPDQLDIAQKQKMGFYEMYDVYSRQTREFVANAIETHSVNYFEWNLDTIAHRIAFNKIRKVEFDKKLPIVNAYVWWLKLLAGKENADVSKQLEYIADQMSLAVYDEPIIDEEFETVAKVVSAVKTATTAALLAFRPALFAKEMAIGLFKGTSLAATQIYGKDQFTVKDLMAAYGKLFRIDNKFSGEFNLIDRLNQYYGFANMDANTVAQKMQTDRIGLFRGLGRYMYMCNTIPDYYNRLSLFLAKMIHDGSYEAHSIVDGKFIYDPTKDNRFKHYLSNRSKYMKNGKYFPAPNDELFNKQRRHYLLVQSQLNTEYKGEREFTETGDLINKAYSEQERSSFKSFTDMAYGYYDKDAQSQANNTWWGMAWLHFMQFWPGKMKMWFAQPTDESPMGRIEHYFITDNNGNKIYKYHKTIEKEDGTIEDEIVDEDTGDPVLKWIGTPYEGLYFAVVGTLKDVFTLNFSKIKNADERNKKVLLALGDAVLIFLLLSLIGAILKAFILENGTEGLAGTTVAMGEAINRKITNEYNVWNSTLGAVNTEPIFLSWGKKVSGDIWDAISGDKEIMDVMTRNVGAAEVFKW